MLSGKGILGNAPPRLRMQRSLDEGATSRFIQGGTEAIQEASSPLSNSSIET